VTVPEDVLAQARAAAAAMRARGAYADAHAIEVGPVPGGTDDAKLYEWAFIEPDVGEVRSTRSFSAPITMVKRLLLRLLGQYHAQLLAEQTRFNVMLLSHVTRLERRIQQLEQQVRER
jgi:hypothetical protein